MTKGRTLIVLVADIVESTRVNAALGPERADDLRRTIFSRFEEAATAHDGNLIKTMGDGCLVTYTGASEAIASGIDMIDTVSRLARQAAGLQLRVGVAVGDVTEENDDVFGEPVLVATRLCKAADPGRVLATDVVRALAGARGGFVWERAGALYLKGVDEPVPCSSVRQPSNANARAGLPRPLRSRPGELFVGRRSAVDTLLRAWKDTATNEGRFVLVSGEPGVGKTRLVAHAARRAHEDGALVLFGYCEEDLPVPFQAITEALRPAVESAPRDLINAHVEVHGGELRRLFPTLRAPDPVDAAPDVERARLIDALADMIVRLSAEQPVVLVIDDLQWAADATIQALRHLLALDVSAPVLVMATLRDTDVDRQHPVTSLLADVPRHDHALRLHLEGLDSSEVEELVEIASGEPMNDDTVRLAAALFERTEGNPFFANQLLRHLDEIRTELYDDHVGTTTFGNLPAGVRDVVARRLSRLGATTNEMLAVAAVAGESFSHAVIGRITSVPNVDSAIDQAVAARILIDDGRGGYTFTHNIVRDVLLAEQTATARARTHEKMVKALLTIYGPGKSAPLHDLAHHACGAAILGNTADAARFSLAAAEACVDRADVRGAIRVLQRGWDAIEHTQPLDHVARFDVCNRLAELHYATFDGVVDALEAAAESARALHSAERLVRLAVHAYRWDISADDPFAMQLVDDALAWLGPEPSAMRALALANGAFLANFLSDGNPGPFRDEAIRVLQSVDDPADPNAVLATEHIALSLMGHGGAARALQFAESVRDTLFAEALPRNGPIFLSGEAAFYAGLGDRDGWDSVTATLDAYMRRTGDPMAMFYGRGRMVTEALFEGRFDEVPNLMATAFEGIGVSVANIPNVMAVWAMWLAFEEGRSAEIVDGLKMVVDMYPGTPGIAAAYAVHLTECGRSEEAAEIVLRLVSELPTAGRNATFGSMIGLLAMANAVIGDTSVAQALLDELEPWCNEIIIVPSVVAVGAGDRFRGCMLSLLGRHDEAVAALEAAIVVEEKLGAKPFVARSRYWLAKALEQRGG